MKIGVCGIAACAFEKGVSLCFECPEFPCETIKSGPIAIMIRKPA
jgi:hypothetical protein